LKRNVFRRNWWRKKWARGEKNAFQGPGRGGGELRFWRGKNSKTHSSAKKALRQGESIGAGVAPTEVGRGGKKNFYTNARKKKKKTKIEICKKRGRFAQKANTRRPTGRGETPSTGGKNGGGKASYSRGGKGWGGSDRPRKKKRKSHRGRANQTAHVGRKKASATKNAGGHFWQETGGERREREKMERKGENRGKAIVPIFFKKKGDPPLSRGGGGGEGKEEKKSVKHPEEKSGEGRSSKMKKVGERSTVSVQWTTKRGKR